MSQRRWVCRWRATWAAGPANTPVCLLQAGDGPLTPHRGCPWARVPRDHGVHPHGCCLCRRPLTKHVFYRDGGEPLRPSAHRERRRTHAADSCHHRHRRRLRKLPAFRGRHPAPWSTRCALPSPSRAPTLPPPPPPRARPLQGPAGIARRVSSCDGLVALSTLSPGRPSPRRSLCRNVQPFLG